MKILKQHITIYLLGLILAGFSFSANAQDDQQKYSEAVKAFNKALELVKQDQYEQAINMYNQAITLGSQAGEQGQNVVDKSENALPQVYYQLAVKNYKDFQKAKSLDQLDATIEAFQKTADIAEEYGNSQYQQKSSTIVTQLFYNKASILYSQQQYNAALASAEKAIERNPNYAKAFHLKAKVHTQEGNQDMDKALEFFDKAIEVGQKVNDSQTVRKATADARDELLFRGVKAMENKNFSRAESLLKRALNYDSESADAYYRLAELSNKRTSWDQAMQYAQQALSYESGSRTDKAKIYFELGMAQKAKGMKDSACSSFEKAALGSFKAPAEHQMEYELKCKSTTR